MTGPTPLAAFVTLGQQLYVLMHPQNADVVLAEIPAFVKSLEACGVHRTRTAADVLTRIDSLPIRMGTRIIGEVAAMQMQAYMEPISRTLYAELNEQVAVAVNTGMVSQQLRQLPTTKALTPTQTDLLNETATCIECGAYRAGAVMGWNLAYDFMRQWIYDNHLKTFNDKLTTHYTRKDGSSLFEAVVAYEDFFTGKPDERTVIDTCYMASLIGERVRDNLRYYLRRRNNYAHPTFTAPSADQTNGYIKELIDTISAPPFKNSAA